MSASILIIGESGTGKSTSIRTLNHKETAIINVLDKPLPFKGYRSMYGRSEDGKHNYLATDNSAKICQSMELISNNRPDIKNIVIDDFQYIMANEFMRKSEEKGYNKFTEIARNAWNVLKKASELRSDIVCFILSHSSCDDLGKVKAKTIGKLLDEKISIEGMFTLVLHSVIRDGSYKFLTNTEGGLLAKSPMEMFDKILIDNDLNFVRTTHEEYMGADVFEEGEIENVS